MNNKKPPEGGFLL